MDIETLYEVLKDYERLKQLEIKLNSSSNQGHENNIHTSYTGPSISETEPHTPNHMAPKLFTPAPGYTPNDSK